MLLEEDFLLPAVDIEFFLFFPLFFLSANLHQILGMFKLDFINIPPSEYKYEKREVG